MGTVRKVPMRKCTGCGEMKSKKEMLRVLKTPEDEIILDATGRKNGRGAYLCFDKECLQKAIKNRGLERSLKTAIPVSVYESLEKEFDKLDNTAYHLVIYKDEQPIAVGRMYFKDKTTMILGRIAALKEYRGQKLGSKVVTALENKARELGCLETELSAQQQAQKFYEKLGYKPDGDMYYDEWCPHVTMKKIL